MSDSTGPSHWYTAVLVVRSTVAGGADSTSLLDLQYHLIHAPTDEDAHRLALEIGTQQAHSYLNGAGDEVSWAFEGLHDLVALDAAPKSGAEMYSRRVDGDASDFVVAKERLSCFFSQAHANDTAAELLADVLPSIHDSLLTGYQVDGTQRKIVMHTEPHQGGGEAFVDVIFTGVVAYQFEGDAMRNIIFEIEPAVAEDYDEVARVIVEQHRQHGVMPGWDPKTETIQQHCDRCGLTLFFVQSSYGMDGWVMAAGVERTVAPARPR